MHVCTIEEQGVMELRAEPVIFVVYSDYAQDRETVACDQNLP